MLTAGGRPSSTSPSDGATMAFSSQRSSRAGSFSARMRSRAASGTAMARTRGTVSRLRAASSTLPLISPSTLPSAHLASARLAHLLDLVHHLLVRVALLLRERRLVGELQRLPVRPRRQVGRHLGQLRRVHEQPRPVPGPRLGLAARGASAAPGRHIGPARAHGCPRRARSCSIGSASAPGGASAPPAWRRARARSRRWRWPRRPPAAVYFSPALSWPT